VRTRFTALDACRWVLAGTAPRVPSSSRVTPTWRALYEAEKQGLIEREGFYWKLTEAGRMLLESE
jgi:hypothetical protein